MKFLLNIWLFTCRHVRFVIGDGAYAMIYPKLGRQNINKVVEKLQSSLNGRAQVFKKDDIPEHLHWKDSKYCPPILVLARPGIFIYSIIIEYVNLMYFCLHFIPYNNTQKRENRLVYYLLSFLA